MEEWSGGVMGRDLTESHVSRPMFPCIRRRSGKLCRTTAVQDLAEIGCALEFTIASWSAAVLRRFFLSAFGSKAPVGGKLVMLDLSAHSRQVWRIQYFPFVRARPYMNKSRHLLHPRTRLLHPSMKTTKLFLAASAAFALVFTSHAGDGKWVSLFNGKDTQNWNNPYDWGEVKIVGDEIHLTADKKFFLVTNKKYSDFVFEAEINLPEGKANSGFMFRCHAQKNKVFGYQAEVDGSDRRWSGGLYDEGRRRWLWPSKSGNTKEKSALKHEAESKAHFAKPEVRNALNRTGWNKYRITCKGDHLKIEVNGVTTTDYHDSTDAEGYIAIQHHGEKGQTYKFRNLRIKELK